jgi:hypothetical protein
LGPSHQYAVGLLFLLADTLEVCGKHGEAEKTYQECWTLLEKTVGYEHLLARVVVTGHARLLKKVGQVEKAHQRFKNIIAAQKRRYGDRHYLVANTLMTYADLLGGWKEASQQERVCREALTIYEQTGSPRRKLYGHCLRSLVSALKAQGKVEEAKPLLQKQAALSR